MEKKKANMVDFFFKSSTKNVIREVTETISRQKRAATTAISTDDILQEEIQGEKLTSPKVQTPRETIEVSDTSDSSPKKRHHVHKKKRLSSFFNNNNLVVAIDSEPTFHCTYKNIDVIIIPVIRIEQYQSILKGTEDNQSRFTLKMKRKNCFSDILKAIYKKLKIPNKNQLLLTYQGAVLFESTQFTSFKLEIPRMNIVAWDKSFYDRWKKEKSALIDMLIEREGSSSHSAFSADNSSPKPHSGPTESEQFIYVKSNNYNVQKLSMLFKKESLSDLWLKFRENVKISQDREYKFKFDGQILDPSKTLDEHGLEPEDMLELWIL